MRAKTKPVEKTQCYSQGKNQGSFKNTFFPRGLLMGNFWLKFPSVEHLFLLGRECRLNINWLFGLENSTLFIKGAEAKLPFVINLMSEEEKA